MIQLLAENHENVSLDVLAREGARQIIASALQQEVTETIARCAHLKDEQGHRLVVRNGTAKTRHLTCGSGTIAIDAPRVHDRREGHKFTSKILPPYLRRTPNVDAVIPALYLKGVSGNAFEETLQRLLSDKVSGLSNSSIAAMKQRWLLEMQQWKRRLIDEEFIYLWADGGLGLWSAIDGLSEFANTKRQRCWVHKIRNVLDKLPNSLQGQARSMLAGMMNASDKKYAVTAYRAFQRVLHEKYPKAVACLENDWEELTSFYAFPAKHWQHLKTTNPIESIFSPLKARLRLTKGVGSGRMGEAMELGSGEELCEWSEHSSCSRKLKKSGRESVVTMKFKIF